MGNVLPKLRRAAIAILALVAAFGVGGYFSIPLAARWGLETLAARELGRAVKVESISANPFTLQVTLRGLSVDGAAGETAPLLTVRQVGADLSVATLLRRAPVVDALSIDGFAVNIVRLEAQRFNFSDIIDRLRAKPDRSDEPARFAVHNIEISDGMVAFDDRVLGTRHAASEIRLGVPFISTLPTDAEIRVQPAFSANLDGTAVELKGETRPFHETLESSIDLKLDGLDITRYLSFSPVKLNFAIGRGTLDTNLRIAFRRAVPPRGGVAAQAARTIVSGTVAVNGFSLAGPAAAGAAPLIDWKSLRVVIDELELLQRRATIADVVLDAPSAVVARAADGSINWGRLAEQPVQQSPAGAPDGKTAAPPFALTLRHAAVTGGRLTIVDELVGSFRQEVTNLKVEANDLTTTSTQRGRFALTADVVDNGSFSFGGEVGLAPIAGQLKYAARNVRLVVVARYLAQMMNATIDGSSDVDGVLEFARKGEELQLALRDITIAGTGIKVRGPPANRAALDIATLSITGGELDLVGRTFTIGQLKLDAPRIAARRLADGSINWLQVVKPPTPVAASATETEAAPKPPAWKLLLKQAQFTNGETQFEDMAIEPAVKLRASAIAGMARNVVGDGSQPAEFSVRARFGSVGTLSANGEARWDRPAVTVRLEARNLDLAALRPYVASRLNAVLARAELSGRGTATLAQPAEDEPLSLTYAGDARLSNLHVLDAAGEIDLLKWQVLDAERISVKVGSPPAQADVGKVALSDFYARIILSDQGRLNLADLVKPATAAGPAGASAPDERAGPPRIRVGGIEVLRGNVNFTDNFVRPNYTANLTNLIGTVGELSSERAVLADVAIRGRIDSDAPVEITGKLNPLVQPLALDIRGSTKGVELPRLTPYSVKYAGYPITRGKLSMDVQYRIEDNKLQADNHLFLDQLTFGERVESPTATKLPVLLAVSLLKNSRGEIDIRLPISGSLDDPQFSIGGLIVQVIVNLLTKVVTAPFTALQAAFGGGADLGYVEFAPGAAQLADAELKKLETLARALNDRPALRLDMTGRALASADAEALRRSRFDARLRAAKVRELVRAGQSVDPATVTIADDERERLVGRVYADEDIAGKPRNFIGMAKTIPAAEMERLIMATVNVGEDELRRLANDRAAAVRDHLGEQGKVPRERLFLVAPLLDSSGDPKLPPTRVDFSLK